MKKRLVVLLLFLLVLITIPTVLASEVFYLHPDYLGSPIGLTDGSGNAVEEYAYGPYGKQIVTVDGSVDNPIGFTGQRFDDSVGLNHFYFRTYDPKLGRFLQRDPSGYADGVNLYEYVAGSPLSDIDPMGLQVPGPADNLATYFRRVAAGEMSAEKLIVLHPEIAGRLAHLSTGDVKRILDYSELVLEGERMHGLLSKLQIASKNYAEFQANKHLLPTNNRVANVVDVIGVKDLAIHRRVEGPLQEITYGGVTRTIRGKFTHWIDYIHVGSFDYPTQRGSGVELSRKSGGLITEGGFFLEPPLFNKIVKWSVGGVYEPAIGILIYEGKIVKTAFTAVRRGAFHREMAYELGPSLGLWPENPDHKKLRAGTISLRNRKDPTVAFRSTSINEVNTGHHTIRGPEAQEDARVVQEHFGVPIRLVERHPHPKLDF